jgi:hypothetical protein
MKKRKAKKPTARDIIRDAYERDFLERARRFFPNMRAFGALDSVVARRALKVLGRPEAAGLWLETRLKQLDGKAPLYCPKHDVLQVLGRLEHGVFS